MLGRSGFVALCGSGWFDICGEKSPKFVEFFGTKSPAFALILWHNRGVAVARIATNKKGYEMEKKYIDMWGAFFSRPVAVSSYRWNGWAVPYFGEEDLPELIEFMNEQEFTGAPFSIDLDGVRGVHTDLNCCEKFEKKYLKCSCECDECREVWGWETLDGARVVSVGGGAWCWSAHTAEELALNILDWLRNDAPTESNFDALRFEVAHRTGALYLQKDFIIELARWNGWELTNPEEFLKSINSSVESAGWVNA